jgi:hypothetical protein
VQGRTALVSASLELLQHATFLGEPKQAAHEDDLGGDLEFGAENGDGDGGEGDTSGGEEESQGVESSGGWSAGFGPAADVGNYGGSALGGAAGNGGGDGGTGPRVRSGQEAAAELRALSLVPLVNLAATAFRALAAPPRPVPSAPLMAGGAARAGPPPPPVSAGAGPAPPPVSARDPSENIEPAGEYRDGPLPGLGSSATPSSCVPYAHAPAKSASQRGNSRAISPCSSQDASSRGEGAPPGISASKRRNLRAVSPFSSQEASSSQPEHNLLAEAAGESAPPGISQGESAPPGISPTGSARQLRASERATRQDGTPPRLSSSPALGPASAARAVPAASSSPPYARAPAATTLAVPTAADTLGFHSHDTASHACGFHSQATASQLAAAPRRSGRGASATPSPASSQSPVCHRPPQRAPSPLAACQKTTAPATTGATSDAAAGSRAWEAAARPAATAKSEGGRSSATVKVHDPFAFDEAFGGAAAGAGIPRGGSRNVVSFSRKKPGTGALAALCRTPTEGRSAPSSPVRGAPPPAVAERESGSAVGSSQENNSQENNSPKKNSQENISQENNSRENKQLGVNPLCPRPHASPPPVRATSAAQEVQARLEHERSHRGILLLSLKVLVNLTNSQLAACEELLRAPRALPLIASILAGEFAGADRRGGLPRHFDTALMCLGLLTNILEVNPDAQAAVASAPCSIDALAPQAGASEFTSAPHARAVAFTANGARAPTAAAAPAVLLLDLLATVLRSLLQPLPLEPQPRPPSARTPDGSTTNLAVASSTPPGRASPVPAGRASSPAPLTITPSSAAAITNRHMEREVAGAYTALLLGFLCRGCAPHCTRVLATLGSDSFAPVSQLLGSFLQLHATAGLLSPEGTKAMASVVEWMSAYGTPLTSGLHRAP